MPLCGGSWDTVPWRPLSFHEFSTQPARDKGRSLRQTAEIKARSCSPVQELKSRNVHKKNSWEAFFQGAVQVDWGESFFEDVEPAEVQLMDFISTVVTSYSADVAFFTESFSLRLIYQMSPSCLFSIFYKSPSALAYRFFFNWIYRQLCFQRGFYCFLFLLPMNRCKWWFSSICTNLQRIISWQAFNQSLEGASILSLSYIPMWMEYLKSEENLPVGTGGAIYVSFLVTGYNYKDICFEQEQWWLRYCLVREGHFWSSVHLGGEGDAGDAGVITMEYWSPWKDFRATTIPM